MKTNLTLLTVLLFLIDCSMAQSLFVNAIEFKGQSEQQSFKALDFDINFEEGKFTISQDKEELKKFTIVRDNDSIQDLVFSPNRSGIAVAMRATDSDSRQRKIVTIDAQGKQTAFKYEAYKMTDKLGWIVELGAVSNNANYILAKCAHMLPKNEVGVSYVRHEWIILKISEASIKIIDSVNAIDTWHDYARME